MHVLEQHMPRTVSCYDMEQSEFAFGHKDFRRIAALLHAETGIALPDTKTTLVYSRLARRLRLTRHQNFSDYFDFISSPFGEAEQRKMLCALTTNVTEFFRERHHFDHLRTEALPRLLQAAREGKRVRIWAAACSSGEEAYSIAMEILTLMPDADRYDIKILATDISSEMITAARAGVYLSLIHI